MTEENKANMTFDESMAFLNRSEVINALLDKFGTNIRIGFGFEGNVWMFDGITGRVLQWAIWSKEAGQDPVKSEFLTSDFFGIAEGIIQRVKQELEA